MYEIEDYEDNTHFIKPCPRCGKAPERNNCGTDYQGICCYSCKIYTSAYVGKNPQDMLLKAIADWNYDIYDDYMMICSTSKDELHHKDGKCLICGKEVDVRWLGEEPFYVPCHNCTFTGAVDERGYEYWYIKDDKQIVKVELVKDNDVVVRRRI